MCLSTVYDGARTPDRILLKNVQHVRLEPGRLVCTDLLERETVFEGSMREADLVNGWIVLDRKEAAE